MPPTIEVRPFEAASEYERMIDYFVSGEQPFLQGMGVDPALLPTRQAWLAACLADHQRPDPEKDRFYLAWLHDAELVGHSSISHIEPGRVAHIHLHLWVSTKRRRGLGTAFVAASMDIYFARFGFEKIASEPYAENRAPNRALDRLGFRHVKRYRTVPSSIANEQDVNRWEIAREAWNARRS
jgi:RimJ/RimL family protein N-acetyltransferase